MMPVRLSQRFAILWVLIALALAPISCAPAKTKALDSAPTRALVQPTSDAPGDGVADTPAPTQETADQATVEAITRTSADTLLVRSFPTGLNTYLIPQSKLEGIGEPLSEYTSDENLVGQTPLGLTLAPGEYAISIAIDPPGYYRKDGEDNRIFRFNIDKDGQLRNVKTLAKVYNIEIIAGRQMLVTALFWPEDQSLVEFVNALPGTTEFPLTTPDKGRSLEPFLENSRVPEQEWSLLQTMLGKTGKAVWYGDAPEQNVVIAWVETAPEWKLDVGPIK